MLRCSWYIHVQTPSPRGSTDPKYRCSRFRNDLAALSLLCAVCELCGELRAARRFGTRAVKAADFTNSALNSPRETCTKCSKRPKLSTAPFKLSFAVIARAPRTAIFVLPKRIFVNGKDRLS